MVFFFSLPVNLFPECLVVGSKRPRSSIHFRALLAVNIQNTCEQNHFLTLYSDLRDLSFKTPFITQVSLEKFP